MSQAVFQTAVQDSRASRRPLLAFNIVDLASLQGVLEASVAVGRPVVVQWSARTVSFYGAKTVAATVRAAADAAGAVAFLHLDHCADDTVLGEALDARFDGVMADGSHLPFEQNLAWTGQWVGRAADVGAIVEGELGPIAGAEDGFRGGDGGATIDAESYLRFAAETRVALLGADIGTAHGIYEEVPRIRMELLRDLADRDGPGFVVHGCSGLDADTIRSLVHERAVKLNYSTDLKLAWASGIRSDFDDKRPEPLTALKAARDEIVRMACERWRVCGAEA